MIKHRLSLVLLACGIAFGSALLIFKGLYLPTIAHDDGISYLAATGHQGLYSSSTLSVQWVPEAKWQSFWKPEKFGVFGTIRRDLAATDIHPPLYFWLLHIWCHIAGVGLDTGPLLNVPFHALCAIARTRNT